MWILCRLRPRDSCRDVLKNLNTLPLQSQYIYTPYCYLL
jgi:hypothetical protein